MTNKEKLELLISENLDLELFYSISISCSIRIQGHYSEETENYLIKRGFEKYDLLYAEDDKMIEYKKNQIDILLCK